MLANYLEGINARGVILASGSVGRAKLCTQMGLRYEIIKSGFAEDADWRSFSSPEEYAMFNARQKLAQIDSDKIIIAADTIISLDNKVYEKPADKAEAMQMMRDFSGRTHKLITALVVKGLTYSEHLETTELTVNELDEETVEAIGNTPSEWKDHSGGYSIDLKLGCTIFNKVNGCFYNIIGLPISSLSKILLKEHKEHLRVQALKNN
ncbi:hypothetical protein SteCoe_5155 [Stentor coeruleus]|uniref:Maf-like protein n=1 Tax=Stentor coeruleus TaxID=5963 RepID=A0A1R2CT48_9CILI|nr:hypothetical protein SteCoe_5155 [Stentor coeruleus]